MKKIVMCHRGALVAVPCQISRRSEFSFKNILKSVFFFNCQILRDCFFLQDHMTRRVRGQSKEGSNDEEEVGYFIGKYGTKIADIPFATPP